MPPMPPPPVPASSGAPSVQRPPPPPLPNRFRKDQRFADLHDAEVAPVWTQPFGRLLLSQLKPSELGKSTVLDVMCHAGYPGLDLLRRYRDARLIAIDPSAALIELARRKAGALVGRRVFFRTEPAEPTLPFDEGVYDLVLSNLGLYDAAQPRRLLHEMARVARPGALVLATLPLAGSFGEFYALMADLVEGRPREAARLEAHLTSSPDAAALYNWAADAGLEDIAVVVQPFSLLLAGAADLFFAPVIEYGPLTAWKSILGDRGPEMQADFNQLREAIDSKCLDGRPFVLTVRAACLRARKPRPPAPPTFEEDPDNAPTSPGH